MSSPTTSCPAARSAGTISTPMYPRCPVTKTFMVPVLALPVERQPLTSPRPSRQRAPVFAFAGAANVRGRPFARGTPPPGLRGRGTPPRGAPSARGTYRPGTRAAPPAIRSGAARAPPCARRSRARAARTRWGDRGRLRTSGPRTRGPDGRGTCSTSARRRHGGPGARRAAGDRRRRRGRPAGADPRTRLSRRPRRQANSSRGTPSRRPSRSPPGRGSPRRSRAPRAREWRRPRRRPSARTSRAARPGGAGASPRSRSRCRRHARPGTGREAGAGRPARRQRGRAPGGSSDHRRLGDRDDELRPPGARVRELRHDFVLEVPGEDEDVVGPGLVEPRRGEDGDVRPRQELAVLVRVAVDGEVDEVGANAAVVEERVPLPRRPVAGDALPRALGGDEDVEQLALRLADALLEARVR